MKQYQAQPMAEPYILERILSLIKGVPKKAAILDIATGQGYMLERLYQLGYRNLSGADIVKANFKLDKKKYAFTQVDANKKLPYKTGQFDLVISSETIEHLENPRAFMRELKRVLQPGGLLILTTPSVENIVSRIYFLFTGRLAFHTDWDYVGSGHIAVTPTWLLERFARELGLLPEKRLYSSFYLPLVQKRFAHKFFLNRFWGWIVIYAFKSPTSTS